MSTNKGYRRETYTDPRTPGVEVEVVVHESYSGDFGGFWLTVPDHGEIWVSLTAANVTRLREQLAPFPQPTYFPL